MTHSRSSRHVFDVKIGTSEVHVPVLREVSWRNIQENVFPPEIETITSKVPRGKPGYTWSVRHGTGWITFRLVEA